MIYRYGLYTFTLVAFALVSCQMHGAELQSEAPKICYLALLPQDLHNCIADFIQKEETDEEFKKRVGQKWKSCHSLRSNSWVSPRRIHALSRDGMQEIMICRTYHNNTYEQQAFCVIKTTNCKDAFCWMKHSTGQCKEIIEDKYMTPAIKKSSYWACNRICFGEEILSNVCTINAVAVCPVIGGKLVATLQTHLVTYSPILDSWSMGTVLCKREICVHDMRTHCIKRYTVMDKTESYIVSKFDKIANAIERPYTIAFNNAGTKVIWLQKANGGTTFTIWDIKKKTVSEKPAATAPEENKLQALFKQYYICKDLESSKSLAEHCK